MKISNSLTNKLEPFVPIDANEVRIYSCGPTVWNYAHIGNFRTFVIGDILRRWLTVSGYNVKYVMNLTDVDDRIISQSKLQRKDIYSLTKPFIKAFNQDMETIGNLPPTVQPKATDHIEEMIEIIVTLLNEDIAYESNGSIYFNIKKHSEYGNLSGIDLSRINTKSRVDTDKYDKENVKDFALWKLVEDDDPVGWDAPFGRGRPGWHIECSAMALKHLGNTIDIHVGGIDLKFPHHENEIAQSECFTKTEFVNYWVHSEFLNIDNKTMSKSSKNVFTLRDLIDKGYSPIAIRYLLLSSSYKKQMNFTFTALDGAEKSVERITQFSRLIKNSPKGPISKFVPKAMAMYSEVFNNAMNNDMNTPAALAALHEFITGVNIYNERDGLTSKDEKLIKSFLDYVDIVLGIVQYDTTKTTLDVDKLVKERDQARLNRKWEKADSIRKILEEQGYTVEDTITGTRISK